MPRGGDEIIVAWHVAPVPRPGCGGNTVARCFVLDGTRPRIIIDPTRGPKQPGRSRGVRANEMVHLELLLCARESGRPDGHGAYFLSELERLAEHGGLWAGGQAHWFRARAAEPEVRVAGGLVWTCPRCGMSIRTREAWPHCPRCGYRHAG